MDPLVSNLQLVLSKFVIIVFLIIHLNFVLKFKTTFCITLFDGRLRI